MGVVTAIIKASHSSTSQVAFRLPFSTAFATFSLRSGSTIWISPMLILSTILLLISTPITLTPLFAKSAPVGNPM